jgi:SSS family solute:Na+ symporter
MRKPAGKRPGMLPVNFDMPAGTRKVVFSLLRISWVSGMFALCMCGCNAVLVYALVQTRSLILWLRAPAIFMESIRAQPIEHVGLVLSVAALVLCGAD